MNELSLFSGAGGGLLGTALLGFTPIGYVEWDDYCQRVLAARIKDGILPDAPIFGDIKTFIDSGCAELYRGITDIVTGGFPCQPFSVAGKQKGADDERNMWPSTATVIGIVRPRFVLLENVPGIRTYLPVVVRDLRRLGYEVSRPLILGADDVGAPHRRKRVWIVANSLRERGAKPETAGWEARMGVGISHQNVAHSAGIRCERLSEGTGGGSKGQESEGDGRKWRAIEKFKGSCVVGNTLLPGLEKREGQPRDNGQERQANERGGCQWWQADPADTICVYGDDAGYGAGEVCGECGSSEICGLSRWGLKSRVGRVVNGCPFRIHRLKALGNMQVSSVVATAWRLLTDQEALPL